MAGLQCKDCPYQYYDYDDEGNATSSYEYCHWVSRCPGDIAPCEEEEYFAYSEDSYDDVYEYEEADE